MPCEFSIIVLAYQRLDSLQRLLYSLVQAGKAFEPKAPIPLWISLDQQSDEKVIHFCHNFFSRYFQISIIQQPQKLGVDGHNLWALSQSEKLNAVMVLEDDVMVAASIFYYACSVLDFYGNDPEIAGISLYHYQRNEACNYPFYKIADGYDTYFYQKVSSRGLLLTKTQWETMQNFPTAILTEEEQPPAYKLWGDGVWEKKWNNYLVASGKYWVHPQVSLTTNFGEPGTHVNRNIYRHAFQSNLQQGIKKDYRFSTLNESYAIYDHYGEPVKIAGYNPKEITADILGIRSLAHITTKFILTTRNCTRYETAYALDLQPAELNIRHNLKGKDLFVTEKQFVDENIWQRWKRELKLHYYFYPDKGLLPLLRLKIMEILARFK